MYAQRAFQIDRTRSLAFAARRGYGQLCAVEAGRPIASSAPFCLDYAPDGTPLVSFHLAKANPLARFADGSSNWLLIVSGDDCYVSPHWYASSDQVPTWLYQAIHLTGPVSLMNAVQLDRHLDALSAHFEAALAPKPVWTSIEVAAGRRQMMQQAIVGCTMAVETVEGSFKLNQHKADADYLALAGALAAQGDCASLAIAAAMRQEKPQLFEDEMSVERSAT